VGLPHGVHFMSRSIDSSQNLALHVFLQWIQLTLCGKFVNDYEFSFVGGT
jgi:hypothetical protein